MTCETIKSMLSEFADERLDAGTAWTVQTHLAECRPCAALSQDIRAMQGILRALPAHQTSGQFEANLAQRLALVRRPERQRTWRDRLADIFPSPLALLRPALALGVAAAAAFSAFFLLPPQGATPTPPPSISRSSDRSLVAACVQQHRSEVAAEPLSDLAAQNLAGQIEVVSPSANSSADETSL